MNAQKQKYLPDLCSGRKLGAFALTEPNAGSDPASLETMAEPCGDHFLLNGVKTFITSGGTCDTRHRHGRHQAGKEKPRHYGLYC